ncbi:uncharacterized protein Dana_GF27588 [Drosophila ananassae]|uniref:Uncharacterized protein n=1 Tax=Drosophila ananassae TaxID=7217 RepID=A0A0P8XH58_DROAN|nr:uncharacterized protein Dana_GF27588 [Drosophila ananassae]
MRKKTEKRKKQKAAAAVVAASKFIKTLFYQFSNPPHQRQPMGPNHCDTNWTKTASDREVEEQQQLEQLFAKEAPEEAATGEPS